MGGLFVLLFAHLLVLLVCLVGFGFLETGCHSVAQAGLEEFLILLP